MTTTPIDRVVAALQSAGCDPRQRGDKWEARCPAHDDHTPSLSIATGADGRALITCQAGCRTEDVVAALKLKMADLFVERQNDDRPKITSTYPYTDENGTTLFEVVRFVPKDFRQRTPDGHGGWTWKLNGVRRVPYRLPELLTAAKCAGTPVFITEGEKDADAIVRAGQVATCCAGGAGKWKAEYAEHFAGVTEVVVVADKDLPGYRHARDVAHSLEPVVEMVRLCEATKGKDVTDHLVAGLSLDDLTALTEPELDHLCWDPHDQPDPTPPQPGPSDGIPVDVGTTDLHRDRYKAGASFVLDDPAEIDPVWGEKDQVLWASGEPFLIVGPPGVGKTTLALQLLAARLGILDKVLGWPVKPAEKPVLYLAMDRPSQIRRAMRRIFGEEHRALLDERLVVWEGPLPFDMGKMPDVLVETAQKVGAGSVFVDSLKDAVIKLSDDESAGNFNRGVQWAIADGIEVLGLHHQRKGQGGVRPKTLEDVYGNTWITAGAGSVVLLWGAAGDPLVELVHLKQPAAEVGPLKVEHDHNTGRSSVYRGAVDPLVMLRNAPNGLTSVDVARAMTESDKPSDNVRKKAQRQLERLVRDDLARSVGGQKGGSQGSEPVRYFAIDDRRECTE